VLETVAQRQRAYPIRIPIPEFVHRYAVVASMGKSRGSASGLFRAAPGVGANRQVLLEKASAIVAILHSGAVARQLAAHSPDFSIAAFTPADAQVGKTTVFMQATAFNVLDRCARLKSSESVTIISRFLIARFSRGVKTFLAVRRSVLICQRLFRLARRLRQCVRQFYEAIWRRIEERHAEERRVIVAAEAGGRSEVIHRDATIRTSEYAAFRVALLPMIGVVMLNVQRVESTYRGVIQSSEADSMNAFRASEENGKVDAAKRFTARREWERQVALQREQHVLRQLEDACSVLRSQEKAERLAIGAQWRPVFEAMQATLRKRALLEKHRDDLVKQLERERALEVARLHRQAEADRIREAALWREHVGRQTIYSDRKLLSERTADAALTESVLNRFFEMRVPSAVVTARPSATNPTSLGNVRSFDDYAKHWRERYERDAQVRETSGQHAADARLFPSAESKQDVVGRGTPKGGSRSFVVKTI
jgi:hypothetical protein